MYTLSLEAVLLENWNFRCPCVLGSLRTVEYVTFKVAHSKDGFSYQLL